MQPREKTKPMSIKKKEKTRLTNAELEQAERRIGQVFNPLFSRNNLSPLPRIVITGEDRCPDGSPYWNNFSNAEAIEIIKEWDSNDESGEGYPPVSQFPVDQSPPPTPLLVSRQEPEKSLVINEKPCSATTPSLVKKPPNKPFQFFGCCGCEDSSEEERTQLTKGIHKS